MLSPRLMLALAFGLVLSRPRAQDGLLFLHFGSPPKFNDRTPPSGPGVNNGPGAEHCCPAIASLELRLSDYQVTLLNNASIAGFPTPVDGIHLRREVVQMGEPSGFIPPDVFRETSEVFLVTTDTQVFGEGATRANWTGSFPVAAGSRYSLDRSRTFTVGGGLFGGLPSSAAFVLAYDVEVASFGLGVVPEPRVTFLLVSGAALVAAGRRRGAHGDRPFGTRRNDGGQSQRVSPRGGWTGS